MTPAYLRELYIQYLKIKTNSTWTTLKTEARDGWLGLLIRIQKELALIPVQQAHSVTINELQAIPQGVWIQALKRYGKHDSRCQTGAPCTCGYDAIEKKLP